MAAKRAGGAAATPSGTYARFAPTYTLPYDETDTPLTYNTTTGAVTGTVYDTSWLTRAWVLANATTVKTVKASGGDYTAAQFSTALSDAATANDVRVIVVDSGLTITGNFAISAKAGTPNWTIVCSSDWYAGTWVPTGERYVDVDTETSKMFVVQGSVINDNVLNFDATGDSKWAFIGAIVRRGTATPSSAAFTLVQVSYSSATSIADLPHDHIFLWSWIDGINYNSGTIHSTVRGIYADGYKLAFRNSVATGFGHTGNDTQAILTLAGGGRLAVDNSLLEASGENFMSGGGSPNANFLPSDLHFRRCYFVKRQEWNPASSLYYGSSASVKNLFEMKQGKRVLIEACILENCWTDAQNGGGLLLKTTNQDNTTRATETSDITTLNTIIRHVGTPLETSFVEYGAGSSPFNSASTTPLNRWEAVNVLGISESAARTNSATRVGLVINAGNGGDEYKSGTVYGPFKVRWYTAISKHSEGFGNNMQLLKQMGAASAVEDSVIDYAGSYGVTSNGVYGVSADAFDQTLITPARNAFAQSLPGRWLRRADFQTLFPAQYTAGLWDENEGGSDPRPAPSNWFVDKAGGNYRVNAAASFKGLALDGNDPGADIDLLESLTSGVADAPSFITVTFT